MQTTRRQVQQASVAVLAVVCAVLAGTHAQDYATRRMMPRKSLHHHSGARIDDQGGPDPALGPGASWRQLLHDTSEHTQPESAQPTEGSGPGGSGGATVTVLPGGLRVIKPAGGALIVVVIVGQVKDAAWRIMAPQVLPSYHPASQLTPP